jgi:hypothetical protein
MSLRDRGVRNKSGIAVVSLDLKMERKNKYRPIFK